MKSLFAVCLAVVLCAICGTCYAANSSAILTGPVRSVAGGQERIVYTITFTADDADGSIPSVTIPNTAYPGGMYLLCTETKAGATPPTSGWAITVADTMAVDLLTGNGASQSTSATVGVATMPSKWIPVNSDLTVGFTGNSVNSATGTLKITFTSN